MMRTLKHAFPLALVLSLLFSRDLGAFWVREHKEEVEISAKIDRRAEERRVKWDAALAEAKEKMALAKLELAQLKKRKGEDSHEYREAKRSLDHVQREIVRSEERQAERNTEAGGTESFYGEGEYFEAMEADRFALILSLMNNLITLEEFQKQLAAVEKGYAERREQAKRQAQEMAENKADMRARDVEEDLERSLEWDMVRLDDALGSLQLVRPEIQQNVDVQRAQDLSADAVDIIVRERTEAGTRSAEERQAIISALYSGEASYDRAGYRIRRSNVVLRPDSQTVTRVYMTDRQDGPAFGLSIVSHKLSYNQALPEDWQSIVSRALNDAANLAGGSPAYYRTLEQLSFASPKGCQLCITQQLEAPSYQASAWAQAYVQRYAVNGADLGYVSVDAAGAPRVGSDTISVTATQDSSTWTFAYKNLSLNKDIFTATVYFPLAQSDETLKGDTTGANSATAGSSLWSLGALPLGRNVEIVLNGPSFTQTIDVVLAPQQYLTLFR